MARPISISDCTQEASMAREPDELTPAEENALILIANLPVDYISTPGRDRQTIARMYLQLYGKPALGSDITPEPGA